MKSIMLMLGIACASFIAEAAPESWSFREGRGITLGEKARIALGIEVAETSDALTIPLAALVETVRGDFVYTRNGPAFLRVPVSTGSRRDGEVEITDGLFEGDEVVIRGGYDLWVMELQAINGGRGCADGH